MNQKLTGLRLPQKCQVQVLWLGTESLPSSLMAEFHLSGRWADPVEVEQRGADARESTYDGMVHEDLSMRSPGTLLPSPAIPPVCRHRSGAILLCKPRNAGSIDKRLEIVHCEHVVASILNSTPA